MSKLSLRQAAAAFAVSRTTLTKDLERGKVSGAKDKTGQWRIDHSELLRVYHPRPAGKDTRPDHTGPVDHSGHRGEPPRPHAPDDAAIRLARVEAELAAEREKTALLERHLDDLRRMLPPPDGKPRRRWWPW
jgi:hypothetical protein